nr:hypothetical protein [Rhizobium album]
MNSQFYHATGREFKVFGRVSGIVSQGDKHAVLPERHPAFAEGISARFERKNDVDGRLEYDLEEDDAELYLLIRILGRA